MGTKSKKRKGNFSEDDDSDSEKGLHMEKKRGKEHKKIKKLQKDKVKEAKRFLKQKRKSGRADSEDKLLGPDVQISELDTSSYFEKNAEFTAWLKDERQIYFNDLSSSEARELFEGFVELWNSRKLPADYYSGISSAQARRSQHSWGIKGNDAQALKLGLDAAMEEERESQRSAERIERRRWKADQKQALDKMLPKATGREALVEKRMARREDARAREASPDIAHVPGGGDMYGGGDDTFAAAKARVAAKTAQSQLNRAKYGMSDARLQEAQLKEDERMAQFRALAAKGPIQIARRE